MGWDQSAHPGNIFIHQPRTSDWDKQQGTNSTAPKLKTVSFCLENGAWSPSYGPVNLNAFQSNVYSCEQLLVR